VPWESGDLMEYSSGICFGISPHCPWSFLCANYASIIMGITREILAPKLGANGTLPRSAEPVGRPTQWWPASPPPSAGGLLGSALSHVCESCTILARLSSICGPYWFGKFERCADTRFVSSLGRACSTWSFEVS
jgi:hypothetical protein